MFCRFGYLLTDTAYSQLGKINFVMYKEDDDDEHIINNSIQKNMVLFGNKVVKIYCLYGNRWIIPNDVRVFTLKDE